MLKKKECPLCGSLMHPRHTEIVVQTPENANTTTLSDWEWLCPDCDYFEDVDDEGVAEEEGT